MRRTIVIASLVSLLLPLLWYGAFRMDVGALPAFHVGESVEGLALSQAAKGAEAHREISRAGQWAVFLTSYPVKGTYMLLSLMLGVLILRRGGTSLRLLGASLLFFFVGELFCMVNYLVFANGSYVVEFLHMEGMVLFNSLVFLWLFEYGWTLFAGAGDPAATCVFHPLCGECTIDGPGCKWTKLHLPAIGSLLVLTIIPLLAEFSAEAYTTTILDVTLPLFHPVWFQLVELRVLPLMAMGFLLVALALYGAGAKRFSGPIRALLAFGAGHLCFSLLRLFLQKVFPDMVWFIAWEELTELLFILLVIWFLWQFHRPVLWQKK